ncbi:MAG: ABC transporter permease [Candidatus Gracilibacteria bacterium]|nr:ABC transporter permease [Candidatus Gracilibacteria bacterium]
MLLFFEIFKLSLKSLKANRLRSALSMLGIVIGVFTIILVVAIGNTVSKAIEDQFKFLNVTTIVVHPTNTANAKSKLDGRDIKYIMKNAKYVTIGTEVFFGRGTVVYKDKKKQYNILSGNENFSIAMPLSMYKGRFFNESEARKGDKVVVIGKIIVDDIFGIGVNPVGKEILISGKIFKIIGTLKPSGGVGSFSFDDSLIMPIETTNKFLSSSGEPNPMIFLADNINNVGKAMEELKIILRKLHNIKPGNDDDFALMDQGAILVLAKGVAIVTKYLLIGVGIIVLIVSGIGIMNVMFAGVAERKKEIGIMMSIGARKKDILNQFIIESVILTIFAGIIGVILGSLVLYIFNIFSPYKVINALSGIILAISFALVTGIFFGIYPARRASNLDPVDALR